MSNSNPFTIILVIAGLLIMVTMGFGIAAPSFGVPDVPPMPNFPTLPNAIAAGNYSATYAFSETHTVKAYYNYVDYSAFEPLKEVVIGRSIPPFPDYFVCQIPTTALWIIPSSRGEPFFYMTGEAIYYRDDSPTSLLNRAAYSPTQLSAQEILNNFNGSYSTFIVDKNDKEKTCFISFSPLPGFGDMANSWNVGNGFTVWLYGNAYTPPDWISQAGALLNFVGNVIGYFAAFAYWVFLISGVLGAVLFGISPTLGGALVVLVSILLVGAVLMFMRGSSGGK